MNKDEPCSICGATPTLLVDAKEKAAYWKCGDCVFEDTQRTLKIETENTRLREALENIAKGKVNIPDLEWDHDGGYWYSRDAYNITPADMREYARKLEAENARLREALEPLRRFPRGQWDWLLDYLPDDDCPEYDALRECLDLAVLDNDALNAT